MPNDVSFSKKINCCTIAEKAERIFNNSLQRVHHHARGTERFCFITNIVSKTAKGNDRFLSIFIQNPGNLTFAKISLKVESAHVRCASFPNPASKRVLWHQLGQPLQLIIWFDHVSPEHEPWNKQTHRHAAKA